MLLPLKLDGVIWPLDPEAPPSVQPLLTAMARGESPEQVIRETAAHFGGCEHFEYGLTSYPRSRPPYGDMKSWLFTTFTSDVWPKLWDQRNYVEVDPRVSNVTNSQLAGYPLYWSCAKVRAAANGNSRMLAFADAAEAHGLGSGVSISLPDARMRAVIGAWSMSDPNPSRARLERLRAKLGEIMVWTSYFHLRIMRSVVDRVLGERGASDELVGNAPVLSTRQVACLALCAEGATVQEVAEKLKLSASTVQTHLNSARHVLAAKSTLHAVVKAMRLKLIR